MEVERVQNIDTLSMNSNTIPETEQHAITTFHGHAPHIPTIDLCDPDQQNLVNLIAQASQEWGIFQVVNHGIPTQFIHNLQSVGKELFQLPQEEKEKETNEEYMKEIGKVVDKVLMCLSLGLGLEEHVLKEGLGGEEVEYTMKISYYPKCPRPEFALGLTPHTDLCALTLLVPNQLPCLQVLKDHSWIDAHYIPNALIVHIGDQIQILSNGKYKSVVHRTTVDKEGTRMPLPVFSKPPAEWVVGPLPQLITQENPPKYKAKKFKDYAYCKLNKLHQ
ncbi:hypothetical protein VNO77_09713 [Canavalia gladiata]|uniref:Fe2OG dioxygenase domain-containing protein n=1 Tax=Canavalia gladiata TaxID=3824 RepID=A0AAN9MF10_CANGL